MIQRQCFYNISPSVFLYLSLSLQAKCYYYYDHQFELCHVLTVLTYCKTSRHYLMSQPQPRVHLQQSNIIFSHFVLKFVLKKLNRLFLETLVKAAHNQ